MKRFNKKILLMVLPLALLVCSCGSNIFGGDQDETTTENITSEDITTEEDTTEEVTTEEAKNTASIREKTIEGNPMFYDITPDFEDNLSVANTAIVNSNIFLLMSDYDSNVKLYMYNPYTEEKKLVAEHQSGSALMKSSSNVVCVLMENEKLLYVYDGNGEEIKKINIDSVEDYITNIEVEADGTYCLLENECNNYYTVDLTTEKIKQVDFQFDFDEYSYPTINRIQGNLVYYSCTEYSDDDFIDRYKIWNSETGEDVENVGEIVCEVDSDICNLGKCKLGNMEYVWKENPETKTKELLCYDDVDEMTTSYILGGKYVVTIEKINDASLTTMGTIFRCYDMELGVKVSERKSWEVQDGDNSFDFSYIESIDYDPETEFVFFTITGGKPHIIVWDLGLSKSSDKDVKRMFALDEITNDSSQDLTELQAYADSIAEKYGIEIYLGDDVSLCSEETYVLTPIYDPVLINSALNCIDEEYSKYPNNMLAQLDDDYGGVLKLFLCENIVWDSDDASIVSTADGLANTLEDDTYICLNIASTKLDNNIHHETMHCIDRYIENANYEFDTDFSSYNPEEFWYSYDYSNLNYDNTIASENDPDTIYFIDDYSSFTLNEDKARTFEFIMFDGGDHVDYYEKYPVLKSKAECIFKYMRSTFDTTNWPETTNWEAGIK